MSSLGSGIIRRTFLNGAFVLVASMLLVGCGGGSEETGTVVTEESPEIKQQVDDMTKFYENNPPGASKQQ